VEIGFMTNFRKLKTQKTSKRATTQMATNSQIPTTTDTIRVTLEQDTGTKVVERVILITDKPGHMINSIHLRKVSAKREITISRKSNFLRESKAMISILQRRRETTKKFHTKREFL
jgi:hypothetical protein